MHARGGQAVGSLRPAEGPFSGRESPAEGSRCKARSPLPWAVRTSPARRHGNAPVAFLVSRQGETPRRPDVRLLGPFKGRPACPRVDSGSQGHAGEQPVDDAVVPWLARRGSPKSRSRGRSQRVPAPIPTVTLRLLSLPAGMEAPLDTIAMHFAGAKASASHRSWPRRPCLVLPDAVSSPGDFPA